MRIDDQKTGPGVRTPLETFLDLVAKRVADELTGPTDTAIPAERRGMIPAPENEPARHVDSPRDPGGGLA
jgi:hypothetical protein